MKKTLLFLLILSLSLSGATSKKLEKTFKQINDDLGILKAVKPPIKFTSDANHTIFKMNWTCNTSRDVLKELAVVLSTVNVRHLSAKIKNTLSTIKENLQAIEGFFNGQIITGEAKCSLLHTANCNKQPLACYLKLLQCLYRNCTVF